MAGECQKTQHHSLLLIDLFFRENRQISSVLVMTCLGNLVHVDVYEQPRYICGVGWTIFCVHLGS